MKKIILAFIIIVLAAGLCWAYMYNGIGRYKSMVIAQQNNRNISKLKTGMTKTEVLKIMGPPNKIEVFALGTRVFEFLLYRTGSFEILFQDKDANFTPVALDSSSGVVLSLDRQFYNDVFSSRSKY